MMKSFLMAVMGTLALSTMARADVEINFDELQAGFQVNGFYNGGTSSDGHAGTNLGVQFSGFASYSSPGIGETSAPNFGFNFFGPAYIDTTFGFTALSFTAASLERNIATVEIYSGTHGSGALLDSFSGSLGNPIAFALHSFTLPGIAHSIYITAPVRTAGFDDFRFITAPIEIPAPPAPPAAPPAPPAQPAAPVPEPSTFALMGLGGIGLAMSAYRRRRAVAKC